MEGKGQKVQEMDLNIRKYNIINILKYNKIK